MSRFTIITDEHQKHPFIPWLICGIGAIFYCYEFLLRIAPSVMSDELMHDFHISAGEYGSLIAFYYYIYTPMQIVVGVLMDRYGPRRLLMVACVCCVIGSFLFYETHSVWMVAISRFLIGFGSAFAFVGALKLATIWLPPERFGFVSGFVTALGMIGAMVGDVFFTHIVNAYGWRPTMLYSGWIGIVIVILILLLVTDRVKTSRTFFYVSDPDFKDVFKGLWASLKQCYIWINGVVGCLFYLALSAFAELWGVPYLERVYQLSPTRAASAIAMIFLGWAIGGPFSGWLSDFIHRRRLPLIIGAFGGAMMISIILYVPIHSFALLSTLLFIFGMFTSVEILVFAVAREVSAKHISGTAIALTNAFVMLGGVLFQPLIGVLLDFAWDGRVINGVNIYSAHAYQLALSVLPIGLLICGILTFFLCETF